MGGQTGYQKIPFAHPSGRYCACCRRRRQRGDHISRRILGRWRTVVESVPCATSSQSWSRGRSLRAWREALCLILCITLPKYIPCSSNMGKGKERNETDGGIERSMESTVRLSPIWNFGDFFLLDNGGRGWRNVDAVPYPTALNRSWESACGEERRQSINHQVNDGVDVSRRTLVCLSGFIILSFKSMSYVISPPSPTSW